MSVLGISAVLGTWDRILSACKVAKRSLWVRRRTRSSSLVEDLLNAVYSRIKHTAKCLLSIQCCSERHTGEATPFSLVAASWVAAALRRLLGIGRDSCRLRASPYTSGRTQVRYRGPWTQRMAYISFASLGLRLVQEPRMTRLNDRQSHLSTPLPLIFDGALRGVSVSAVDG